MNPELEPSRFPRVPFARRASAFVLDFLVAWIISGFAASNAFIQGTIFLLVWWISRVLIVERNRGQSLGRWCFDLAVLDARLGRPAVSEVLLKREAIAGGTALLAMAGLTINLGNPISMLLLLAPVLVDGGAAYAGESEDLALHDRFSETVVVASRRGISLDLRLKALWQEIQIFIRDRTSS
ncbi:MAG: RDD family protein [Cyanobacteria bacterium P01_H01_bin.15]